jgi:uncharacterized OB-fold protein
MTKVGHPRPEITAINRPFWDAATTHRLLIQHCSACQRYQHVPLVLCPRCSSELGWRESRGDGTLHSYTLIHRVYHPFFADAVPYNVSVVTLEEGPQMVSSIIDCPLDALRIGMQVRVAFQDIDHGLSLPVFRRSEASNV